MDAIERLLVTLWVGGLWTIGFVAVPLIFTVLDAPEQAGTLAAELFRAIGYIGVTCGLLLGGNTLLRQRRRVLRHWPFWVVIGMWLLSVVSVVWVQPAIIGMGEAGMAGTDAFERLHTVASTVYLITSLLGLGLVLLMQGGGVSRTDDFQLSGIRG